LYQAYLFSQMLLKYTSALFNKNNISNSMVFYHFPVSHGIIPRDHNVIQNADPQKNILLVVYLGQTQRLCFFLAPS